MRNRDKHRPLVPTDHSPDCLQVRAAQVSPGVRSPLHRHPRAERARAFRAFVLAEMIEGYLMALARTCAPPSSPAIASGSLSPRGAPPYVRKHFLDVLH
jgi:hypothetical protein